MRKMLLAVAACLLAACLPALAQNGGWEVSLGISLPGYDRFTNIAEINTVKNPGGKVSRLILPAFSVQGGYIFPQAHLGLFLCGGLSYAQARYTGGPSPLLEREPVFYLMPQLRLYYKNSPRLRLYAFAGAGVRIRHFAETFDGSTLSETNCSFAWQFSPFGMSVGERWAFSFDLGTGFAWMGAQLSVGYRF